MVTFRVSKTEASIIKGSLKDGGYQTQSSSNLPPGHYLHAVLGKHKISCSKLLQESEWEADKVDIESNGFVDTVIRAYNCHHNLVLRPDDVWLAILVQFSSFVNGNAAELRHLFVSHEGKKELVVAQVGNMNTVNYSVMTLQFVEALRKNVKDPELADWILPNFTTTTMNDTVVCSVVMMATMKEYFHYGFYLLCGIPEVTLLGTVEDWQKLAGRVDKLRSFGEHPAKWADMLHGVLRQFVAATQGNADIAFWERICSHHGRGSGPRYISGWISTFCVFDSEGKWQGDYFQLEGHENGVSEYPVINTNYIPPGHVTVPVKIDDNSVIYESIMLAGHMLTELVTDTTLGPKATWAMLLESAPP